MSYCETIGTNVVIYEKVKLQVSCYFGSAEPELVRLDTTPGSYLRPLTPLPFSASQNHPVPEAAEDQGAAAESDRGLWPADGHVLHGERGTKTTI